MGEPFGAPVVDSRRVFLLSPRYLAAKPTPARFACMCVCVCSIGLALGSCGSRASDNQGVGRPAPRYAGTTLTGEIFDLSARRGDVVLINVWATWCQPCREELPELNRLHETHASQRFSVAAISIDEQRAEPRVRRLVDELSLSFPVVLDPRSYATSRFDVQVFPTSLLVNRAGTVVWRRAGIVRPNDSELAPVLHQALNERGPLASTSDGNGPTHSP